MEVYAFFTAFAGIIYFFIALRFFSLKREATLKYLFTGINLLLCILSFLVYFAIYAKDQETKQLLYRLATTGWITLPLLLAGLIIPFSQQYTARFSRIILYILLPLAVALIVRFHWAPSYIFNLYQNPRGILVYTLNTNSFWPYLAGFYYALAGTITLSFLLRLKKGIYPYASRRHKWQFMLLVLPLFFFYLVIIATEIILPSIRESFIPGGTHLIGLIPAVAVFHSFTMHGSTTMIWEELSGIFIQRIKQLILFLDSRGNITYVNRFAAQMMNYPIHEILGKPAANFFNQPLTLNKQINLAGFMQKDQKQAMFLLPQKGSPLPCLVNVIKVNGKVFEDSGYVLVGLDIREKVNLQSRVRDRIRFETRLQALKKDLEKRVSTRQNELLKAKELLDKEVATRKEIEKKLIKDLAFKEDMLREIHHRVKNNMQMVISLINMISTESGIKDDLKHEYGNLARRIRDVSYIHDYFYNLPSMGHVNFNHFITRTTSELRSTKLKGKQILFKMMVSDKPLTVKQAIPCGIIVYELLTNAIQHAFPEAAIKNRPIFALSTVYVEFTYTEHSFQLFIKDNGIGLPARRNYASSEGLGLDLVNNIVKEDLQGDISFDNDNGTCIRINFHG